MGSRKVLVSLLTLPALLLAGVALAQPAAIQGANNIITKVEVISGQQDTRIVFRGEKTPTFTVFKLKNPDRLVVDLINSDLKVDVPAGIEDAHISRIAGTQFRQAGSVVSRFIIGMKPGVRFGARAEGSALVVTISAKSARRAAPAAVRAQAPAPAQAPRTVAAKKAEKDFRVVQSRGERDKAGKVAIRSIDSGHGKQITILADRAIENYEVLEVFSPFRIVLDVFGASMPEKKLERKLSSKYISELRAARHAGKVRVVVDCVDGKRRPYRIERLKRGIRLSFQDKPLKTAAKPKIEAKPKIAVKPILPVPPRKVAEVKDVDFRQDENEARVVIDLQGDAEPRITHSDARSAVLQIDNCKMPLLLERTLDTSEFGGSVKSLSAYMIRGEKKVKLVAVTGGRVANRIERRNGKLNWVFAAGTSAEKKTARDMQDSAGRGEAAAYSYEPSQVAGYSVRRPELASGAGSGVRKRRKYHGKRISLDFKDADIHNILRLISEVAKLNIITGDDVKGKITVTMRNVPWDQALEIILKTKKLGKVRQGNIIRIASMADLAKEQELAQKAAEAKLTLEPLRVRLIPVNYAVAGNIQAQVKDVLSGRGTVNVDVRTNVLIVKDILQNLVKAEGLVRSLDTETPQVLIEARIVEANTQFVREVGIQWGGDLAFSEQSGNPTGLPFPSSFVMQGGADDTQTMSDMSGTANPGKFAINLPAAVGAGSGGALGFLFGSAGGSAHLNLRLSALENQGAVKIVSAPKITTLDNQKAKIAQGVSIPISVVSAAGVNTQFVEAKLELEVSPHITQEGSILLSIKVNKNEPDFSRTGARGDPTILKKEAQTQVLVRDGDTTVIGGIYTRKTSDTFSGIPVLSQIPVLGWFFRNTKKNDERTELLIFITPRIVNRLRSTVSQR
ncbi:MAG TPA: type IV pilus secretin PilQ [Myxococcota bacterium]|nr:type IV pilus secretin PilQ [Myxococcota bacterium]